MNKQEDNIISSDDKIIMRFQDISSGISKNNVILNIVKNINGILIIKINLVDSDINEICYYKEQTHLEINLNKINLQKNLMNIYKIFFCKSLPSDFGLSKYLYIFCVSNFGICSYLKNNSETVLYNDDTLEIPGFTRNNHIYKFIKNNKITKIIVYNDTCYELTEQILKNINYWCKDILCNFSDTSFDKYRSNNIYLNKISKLIILLDKDIIFSITGIFIDNNLINNIRLKYFNVSISNSSSSNKYDIVIKYKKKLIFDICDNYDISLIYK